MKKTLIALAVASAAVATGVNASEVYNQDGTTLSVGGRAEARMNISDGDVYDKTRVRINLAGKVAVTDDFYGIGFYEGEFMTDDSGDDGDDALDNRYAYAGFGGAAGELTYGKNDGALGMITDFTDTLNDHSGSASRKLAVADRVDNILSYKGSFDSVTVKAAYKFADRTTDPVTDEYDNNETDGASLGVTWAAGDTGIALGLGGATQSDDADGEGDKDQVIGAVSYTLDGLYLAALYSNTSADVDTYDQKGFELTAQYTQDQATYYATYGNGETDGDTAVKYVTLEGEYKFKPNFKGYVSYNINMLDENEGALTFTKAQTEDDVTVGLRYDF